MTPSIKTLEAAFPGKGKELRKLLDGSTSPRKYKSVQDWLDSCYNKPSGPELVMRAVDEVLEGYGTEALFNRDNVRWPDMEYVNMGDTYNATVIYDYTKGRYMVTSWGEWVEARERRGIRYE